MHTSIARMIYSNAMAPFRKLRQALDLRDLVNGLGLLALGAGLWGYDRRLALVVVGSLLLLASNWQSIRGLMRHGPRE